MGISGINDKEVVQGMLFDGKEPEKQGRVDVVADKIKEPVARRGIALFAGVMYNPDRAACLFSLATS